MAVGESGGVGVAARVVVFALVGHGGGGGEDVLVFHLVVMVVCWPAVMAGIAADEVGCLLVAMPGVIGLVVLAAEDVVAGAGRTRDGLACLAGQSRIAECLGVIALSWAALFGFVGRCWLVFWVDFAALGDEVGADTGVEDVEDVALVGTNGVGGRAGWVDVT